MNATPQTATEALRLARDARDRADHAESERMGLRAAHLAEGTDPETVYFGRILAGLAYIRRGSPGRASRLYRRALDVVAAAPEMEHFRGPACHHLFMALQYAGQEKQARIFFERAARAYGEDDPRAVGLHADRALLVHLCSGDFHAAARMLEPLAERAPEEERARLRFFGMLAVSLAGAGERPGALAALHTLSDLLETVRGDAESWGWVSMARTYQHLGEARSARRAASTARRIAARHQEEKERRLAVAVLR